MEVINKTYEDFNKINGRGSIPFVGFRKNEIFFSAAAVEELGLAKGLRLHFMVDIDRLYFFTNNDPAGLSLMKRSESSLVLKSPTMFNILKTKLPHLIKEGLRAPVKEMKTKINGHPSVEILLHKRL